MFKDSMRSESEHMWGRAFTLVKSSVLLEAVMGEFGWSHSSIDGRCNASRWRITCAQQGLL